MITLLTIFITSFIIALSGAMMPGPLLTVTISESAKRGVIAGPMLIVGHSILELLLVMALMMGLAPFISSNLFFSIIGISGGIVLLWMAYGMISSLSTLSISFSTESVQQEGYLIVNGIIMSLANPYWTVWWATIGLGYILNAIKLGIIGVVFFFIGHILADFVWYTVVSGAVAKGKHFMTDKIYRIIIFGCAVLLTIFGCYFLVSGIGYIDLLKDPLL